MDIPDATREMTVRAAEHEIFLSFTNDIDAELFDEWWRLKGGPAFQKWAEKEISRRAE